MKRIPYYLVYSRIFLALAILVISFTAPVHHSLLICLLIIAGLLTDIFDGIIARKLEVSSLHLRKLDSGTDTFFWTTVLISAYLFNAQNFLDHRMWVFLLLCTEAYAYIVSYARFGKPIVTHTIFSKVWVLLLVMFFLTHFSGAESNLFFFPAVIVGIVSRMEIIIILMLLNKWETDIPSVFHVKSINAGRKIRRSKLFNG